MKVDSTVSATSPTDCAARTTKGIASSSLLGDCSNFDLSIVNLHPDPICLQTSRRRNHQAIRLPWAHCLRKTLMELVNRDHRSFSRHSQKKNCLHFQDRMWNDDEWWRWIWLPNRWRGSRLRLGTLDPGNLIHSPTIWALSIAQWRVSPQIWHPPEESPFCPLCFPLPLPDPFLPPPFFPFDLPFCCFPFPLPRP